MSLLDLFNDYASVPTGAIGYGPPVDRPDALRSSGYGRRGQPKEGASTNHKAYDVVSRDWADTTNMNAVAVQGGEVTYAGKMGGYGLTVEVTHPNGDVSRYSHLDSLDVSVGDEVGFGQELGSVGNTGISSGAHLDFGLRDAQGNKLDPATRGYGANFSDTGRKGYPSLTSAINPDVTSLGTAPIDNIVDYAMAPEAPPLDGGLLGTAIADVERNILSPQSIQDSFQRANTPLAFDTVPEGIDVAPQDELTGLIGAPQAPTPAAKPEAPITTPDSRIDAAFGLLGDAPTLDVPSAKVDTAFEQMQGAPTFDPVQGRIAGGFGLLENAPTLDLASVQTTSPTRGPDHRGYTLGLYDRMQPEYMPSIAPQTAPQSPVQELNPVQVSQELAPVETPSMGLLSPTPMAEQAALTAPNPQVEGLLSTPAPEMLAVDPTVANARVEDAFSLFGPEVTPETVTPTAKPDLDVEVPTQVAPGLEISVVEPANPTPEQAASPAANQTVTVRDDLQATGALTPTDPTQVEISPESTLIGSVTAPGTVIAEPPTPAEVAPQVAPSTPSAPSAPRSQPVQHAPSQAPTPTASPGVLGTVGQALGPESFVAGLAPSVRDLASEIGRAPPEGAQIGYSPIGGTAAVYGNPHNEHVQVAATGPGLFGAIDRDTGTKIGSRMEQGLSSMAGGYVGKGVGGTVGGMAGTAVGGPVGGMVGGLLGSLIGGRLGRDSLDYAAQRYGGLPVQASSISYGPGLLGSFFGGGNDGLSQASRDAIDALGDDYGGLI